MGLQRGTKENLQTEQRKGRPTIDFEEFDIHSCDYYH
jgi:hypothetical protein